MSERVVITGIGMASPDFVGSEVESVLNFYKKDSCKSAIENIDNKLEEFIPYKLIRRMCRFSQLALYSNILCKNDSGLQIDGENDRTGSIMNTSYGPLNVTEHFLETLIQSGPQSVSPMDFSNTVNNCATGQVSISMKLKGVSTTLIGSSAVSYAFDLLQNEKANAILVSGVEEYEEHLEQISAQKGYHMKENSCCILAETFTHAQERNAKIYAEILECKSFYINDNNAEWIYENILKEYVNGTVFYYNSSLECRKIDELMKQNEATKLIQNEDIIFGATEVQNCLTASCALVSKSSKSMQEYALDKGIVVTISIQQNGCGSIVVLRRND